MTVSTTLSKQSFPGNGATTTFTFTFPAVAAGDLDVYFTDTDGTLTLLAPSSYSVVLNPTISPNPTAAGGVVTYPLIGSPIALGTLLTIIRNLPETQDTSLSNQGTLYQTTIEQAFDYLTMLIQQVQELFGRGIVVAVSDPAPDPLPPVAQRANLLMGFDTDGNPTAVSAGPTGVISSAMAPVVGAASLAAARTALGLGDIAVEDIGLGLQDDGSGNVRVNPPLSAVAVSQAPALANHLTNYWATGNLTFTLPKASTLFSGWEITVFGLTGTTTFAIDVADSIGNLASGTSLVLAANTVARIKTDGVATWQVEISRLGAPTKGMTRTTVTSGSGNYAAPQGCKYFVAKLQSAGGGSGGTGTGTPTAGGAGTNSSFNAIVATGGGAGPAASGTAAVNGAAGGGGGTGTAQFRRTGGAGMSVQSSGNYPVNSAVLGGQGGISMWGSPGQISQAQAGAPTGFGAGASGNGTANPTVFGCSPGAGAGEYIEIIVTNPTGTYAYVLGAAGGAGNSGGGGGAAGVAGGNPLLVVDEYY